ncbi:unnamed protein product [Brassica napus]|uniref:(rape) hypothetical protein n=1 Tax=Brassica napus TaxID=3708 RepID=A0A817A478_BRANA|nr:unnamed protein product [Brassica napus]
MVEGVSKALWIVVATVFAVAAAVTPVACGQQAPCYFVFGDSQFDNGNNNVLSTTAKVNYLPYGIDFPEGPTGRFSNGRNIPDVIAELAGFNDSIPPFAGASPGQANIGLNYASGGGGIREETSQNLGERISLRRQINNHQRAIINAAVPRRQLRQCLYTINVGSNDYLNNYFLQPPTPARSRYNPEQFAESLIRLYNIYLKQLYLLGARKVALFEENYKIHKLAKLKFWSLFSAISQWHPHLDPCSAPNATRSSCGQHFTCQTSHFCSIRFRRRAYKCGPIDTQETYCCCRS